MTSAERRRRSPSGLLGTLVGLVFLTTVGFALGLLVGTTYEEPDLVLGHLRGETESHPLANVAAGPAAGDSASAGEAGVGETVIGVDGPRDAGDIGAAPGSEAGDAGRPVADAREAPSPRAAPDEPRSRPRVAAVRRGFAVQVGAFREAAPAEGLAARLRARGLPDYVAKAGRAEIWRVRVGQVATRDEADAVARELKQQEGLPTWVLAEERPS